MGVNHRRPDVGMAEHFLDRTDIVIRLEQVGREGMSQRVSGYSLRKLSSLDGKIYRILKARIMYVVPPLFLR